MRLKIRPTKAVCDLIVSMPAGDVLWSYLAKRQCPLNIRDIVINLDWMILDFFDFHIILGMD